MDVSLRNPHPPNEADAGLEAQVRDLGGRLLGAARERKSAFWARERWEEGMLRKLMDSGRFRIQALRFVDVLPALKDDTELARHVAEYFEGDDLPIPGIARWGIEKAQDGVAQGLLAKAVRVAIHGMATRFIGGSNVAEAYRTVEGIRKDGMAFTLDLLGEAAVSESESHAYFEKYLHLLDELSPKLARWRPDPLLDTVSGRTAPRFNLSVKVSSLFSQMSPVDPAGSAAAVKERLRPILRSAQKQGAFICLDMEQYDFKGIVLRVLREVLMEPEFRDWPDAGLAMQAYLRDTEADLRALIEWAKQRGTPVTVRLVRGAYWDYETVVAGQNGWMPPVWMHKSETDRCYERCMRLLIENHPHIEAAIATHNVRSLALGMALAEERGLQPGQFELQMLYGMADPLKDAVAKLGHRLRVYVPFGELLPGMSYLVRRLLENTAGESFLRMGFADDVSPEKLLSRPAGEPEIPERKPAVPTVSDPGAPSMPEVHPPSSIARASVLQPFVNEPNRRFTDAAERDAFAAAIERVRGELGRDYPLLLHGRELTTGAWQVSHNPARPNEIVGRVAEADEKDAETAIESANAAFPGWRDTPVAERAELLLKASSLIRERRDEFSAWQIFEAGKTWREADADVTEAIDFLEYYAREAIRLGDPIPMDVPGEYNSLVYEPRGVAVVIPPWNFPLAIMTGMVAASLATGNTVILKPAEQTPVIAAKLVDVLRDAGLPEGVLNFVPGVGEVVGEHLVKSPRVHLIAFTGSMAVGTRIFRIAAELAPGQTHLKRVIAEMGGKNALIIDADADLDDAVHGAVASAFGHQGQKCSAASRLIVVGEGYEEFMRRLVAAAESVQIGPPEDPGSFMGPVIDQEAYERIQAAIAKGKSEATVALETDTSSLREAGGWFIGPTVFTDVPPVGFLAQQEIFGPVLAVERAKDFDEALRMAQSTQYALTGGVYSRSPSHLEQAKREFRVGNLYLNRKITGALVNRQPFGGFKLSGVGSKAGGPDYLLQFVEPRVVTENTLRRGFAPDFGGRE